MASAASSDIMLAFVSTLELLEIRKELFSRKDPYQSNASKILKDQQKPFNWGHT